MAFFAPFDGTRYFFPWTPIQVSPIGAAFLTAIDIDGKPIGVSVLSSELRWIWIPSGILTLAAAVMHRRGRTRGNV